MANLQCICLEVSLLDPIDGIGLDSSMTFRLKWFDRPSTGVGIVQFHTAEDAQVAVDIFTGHGYSLEEEQSSFRTNTKAIKYIPLCYQHDTLFEEHVREMLQPNGVKILSAHLLRSARFRNEDLVHVYIGREIVEYLDRREAWHRPTPWLIQEWRAFLLSEDVPWRWNVLDINDVEEICAACEAEMVFDSVELGIQLVEYLMSRSRTIYNRKYNVFQKIFLKPVYCATVPVTKEVRVACDTLIRQLNDEGNAAAQGTDNDSHFLKIVDLTWDNALDNCDVDITQGELSVQGWPVCRVQEVATRLISLFDGSYIDCYDEVYARLLYGFGAKYLDFVRTKLRGKVVIDVDLLRERITVVGESADLAKEKLKFFAENSHAFKLDEVITLGPPRYLFFIRDLLCFGVGKSSKENLRWR